MEFVDVLGGLANLNQS